MRRSEAVKTKKARSVLVSFRSRGPQGDALLGGLIVASKLAEEDEWSGELIVVAPAMVIWPRADVWVWWRPKAYRVRALVGAVAFADSANRRSSPRTVSEPGVVTVDAVTNNLTRPGRSRSVCDRARTAALEGLASKHGGAIRGFERSVELVIMARRVADLRADESGVLLNTVLPTRSTSASFGR